MADGTKIEWADATVNAINGCSLASPGCTNCYAMRLAGTRLRNHPSREGLTQPSKAGPVWNGTVKLSESALLQPLKWRSPRVIFWNAHGDTFHEAVPDEWIDRMFAVMALTPQHKHLVLTKRAARMRAYFTGRASQNEVWRALEGLPMNRAQAEIRDSWYGGPTGKWPLPNVWLGVSVEDQARADERIPDLLATPAAGRFLSCEPLLGPVDVGAWLPDSYECGLTCGKRLGAPPKVERCVECGEECDETTEPVISEGCPKCSGELEYVCPDCGHYMVYQHPDTQYLDDWMRARGESGGGSVDQAMHPDWARALRDQCAAVGIDFHFKQWGDWRPYCAATDDFTQNDPTGEYGVCGARHVLNRDERPGPENILLRAGKKAAGRELDGTTHDALPWRRAS